MKVSVYTDGGSRGNPGPSAFAVVLTDGSGKVIKEFSRYLGRITNNEAEYKGAIAGLIEAKALGADEVDMTSDSELMVRQINGQYSCRAMNLQPLLLEVHELMGKFKKAKFSHVHREDPMISRADRLVNEELDVMEHLSPKGKPNP